MCHNIQLREIQHSTRLRLETKTTIGKSFQWKTDHPETTKPVKTVFKIETTEKEDPERLKAEKFSPAFSQFKEGSRQINESKALEWMDAKVKIKEVNISNDDRPKIAKIGEYWNVEQTT